MDALDEITRRLRLSRLQARLEVKEILCGHLSRKIQSPQTPLMEQQIARQDRDKLTSECADIREELKTLLEFDSNK